jgi:hypothetical protein
MQNAATARTKALRPLIEAAKRVVLLSGTPALSRPMELYTQLNMLKPDVRGRSSNGLAYLCLMFDQLMQCTKNAQQGKVVPF